MRVFESRVQAFYGSICKEYGTASEEQHTLTSEWLTYFMAGHLPATSEMGMRRISVKRLTATPCFGRLDTLTFVP